jgi:magnesium transporter
LADPEKPVSEIMTTNVVSVPTLMDKEDVALLFSKYDFLALPVVDKQGLLVGIITVDDAFDVMSEADEEDISKMAAITPTDRPYLKTSAIEIWLNRIPWLLILMLSATFTGIIISSFENALATQVVLTAFIPMLMGTGGNAGSQASVTVIRGISLGEIEFRDLLAVIWKEIRVAVLCGATLAVATFGKLMLVDKFIMGGDITLMVALVVSVTQLLTVICAKIIGCLMPMLADKLHLDPAVMASPFITTIVDALSLLVYFAIASMLLGL